MKWLELRDLSHFFRLENSNRIALTYKNFCSKIGIEIEVFWRTLLPSTARTSTTENEPVWFEQKINDFGNYSSGRPKLHGGGISRASRGIGVISVATAEPSAAQKCQFSGISAASRQQFRRNECTNCNIYNLSGVSVNKIGPKHNQPDSKVTVCTSYDFTSGLGSIYCSLNSAIKSW